MVMLNETPAGNAAEVPVLEARTPEEAEALQRLMAEQQYTQMNIGGDDEDQARTPKTQPHPAEAGRADETNADR